MIKNGYTKIANPAESVNSQDERRICAAVDRFDGCPLSGYFSRGLATFRGTLSISRSVG